MELLSGTDLAARTKIRHTQQIKGLKSSGIIPKLAIVQVKDDPVINTYVRLKKQYGADIGASVEVHTPKQDELPDLIGKLNSDETVHGIIVQLPLDDTSQTEEIVNLVAPEKDVDALGTNARFDPATPMAILWLLAGHNIDLKDKKILLIGRGKLVGAPLERMLKAAGYDVRTVEESVKDLKTHTFWADIIITATGHPAILHPKMIKAGAVIVDAGVASESGKTVGDLAPEVYNREDLTITPQKGGVGPLTVCALFENLIKASDKRST